MLSGTKIPCPSGRNFWLESMTGNKVTGFIACHTPLPEDSSRMT
jgi:hypothetical protein